MEKNTPYLLTFCLLLCFYLPAHAQSDSTRIDLGSVKLKKDFTQTISIKGEELEKMPFSRLSDVIGAWLYSAYSDAGSLIYVVDGNPVSDVDRYSIYDIKEINFVQSALIQISNVSDQQQLVLITTRKAGTKRSGGTIAGMTSWVRRDIKQAPAYFKGGSDMNLYHQYYLSGYYNRKKIQLGISADYMHDVFPSLKSDTIQTITPYHSDRFRFNGFMDVSLGQHHHLYVNMNVVPERISQEQMLSDHAFIYSRHYKFLMKQLLITPYLQLQTRLLPNLQNSLSAAYEQFNTSRNENLRYSNNDSSYGWRPTLTTNTGYYDSHITQLFIRDHLSYTLRVGNWYIEPALNVMYMHTRYTYHATGNFFSGTASNPSGLPAYVSQTESYFKGHFFSLISQLNLSYKNIFYAGGGGYAFLPPARTIAFKKAIFPFAFFSMDLLKISNPSNKTSLKLFGSYARNYNGISGNNLLYTFPSTSTNSQSTPYSIASAFSSYAILSPSSSGSLFQPHEIVAAGVSFSLRDEKLQISYNVEKRNYTTIMQAQSPSVTNPSTLFYPDITFFTHHLAIKGSIIKKTTFYWQSGINITTRSAKISVRTDNVANSGGTVINDNRATPWTGGWINHAGYKRLLLGVNILYRLNQYKYIETINGYRSASDMKRWNPLLLQHIYAGYTFLLKGHDINFYLSSRNLLQNDQADISDGRQYYALGFKAGL